MIQRLLSSTVLHSVLPLTRMTENNTMFYMCWLFLYLDSMKRKQGAMKFEKKTNTHTQNFFQIGGVTDFYQRAFQLKI